MVAEPTDRNRVLPSFEKASVRVTWPPLVSLILSTTTSGSPLALTSPTLYGKRTIELTLATYRYSGLAPAGHRAMP